MIERYRTALSELGPAHDDAGFLARVEIATEIARQLLADIPVQVDPRRTVMGIIARGRSARVIEEAWARRHEAMVQAAIPPECGLRFYIHREMKDQQLCVGFRDDEWDTATI